MNLSLSWDLLPLEQQNGMIRFYSVSVFEVETGINATFSSMFESITLQNLHPYYTYSVEVSANTIAPGPYSSPLTVITDQDGNFSTFSV